MDDPGFESRDGQGIFLFSQTSCSPLGSIHQSSCSMGTLVLTRTVKLITYGHLVPRLRMNGAILLLPLYACMAWTGKLFQIRSSRKTNIRGGNVTVSDISYFMICQKYYRIGMHCQLFTCLVERSWWLG